MKEDPATFLALAEYLPRHGMGQPVSYVDDAVNRIKAAAQANRDLGEKNLGRLYHFDPKASSSSVPGEGYTIINDLLHIG